MQAPKQDRLTRGARPTSSTGKQERRSVGSGCLIETKTQDTTKPSALALQKAQTELWSVTLQPAVTLASGAYRPYLYWAPHRRLMVPICPPAAKPLSRNGILQKPGSWWLECGHSIATTGFPERSTGGGG